MSNSALAVSSWSWHDDYYAGRWSLLDLPAAAAAAGLAYIECNDFMLPPPPLSRIRRPLLGLLPGAPPALWRYSRRSLRQLGERARAHGTKVLAWTLNSDFAVSDRDWFLQKGYMRMGVAAARRLQAPLLRLNLGGEPETPAEKDGLIASRLASCVEHAHKQYPGLVVTVENHWGLSTDVGRHLQIVRQANRLLPASSQDTFGCCFDPYNLPQDERERWWPALAAAANHFHFKTMAFDEAGNEATLPYEYLLGLLRENGYRGHVTIEFQGDGEALEQVRLSKALYERLSGGK